jgi:hypothetical protein
MECLNTCMTDNPDVYNPLKISPRGEWNRDTQITEWYTKIIPQPKFKWAED